MRKSRISILSDSKAFYDFKIKSDTRLKKVPEKRAVCKIEGKFSTVSENIFINYKKLKNGHI